MASKKEEDGAIKVFCRLKPLMESEKMKGDKICINFNLTNLTINV
jgi:hypothetical protein